MRKRARQEKRDNISLRQTQIPIIPTRPKRNKSKIVIFFILIGIMFLVLFFNTFFNYSSGTAFNENGTTLGTRFFLSGPDPYYNMRLCQITLQTGHYPFVVLSDGDPLLNYPVGIQAGSRPPLFNFMAIASASVLSNFMPQMDALGWAMLFLPAIYGALVIFPIYGIGKELFNYKVGLVAAILLALTPIHIGSGHGSAFSLFDHDSFLTLLFTLTFYFIIKAYKSNHIKKTYLYAILGGLTIGAVHLSWAASQEIFLLICIFLFVQLFIDLLKGKYQLKNIGIITTVLSVGFFISLPYSIIVQELPNYPFYTFILSLSIFCIYCALKKLKLPSVITIPSYIASIGIGLLVLYLVKIQTIIISGLINGIASVIFGKGIYGQKISLTIAEAHTFSLSQTVMSFGPSIFLIALIGVILFLYKNHKQKWQPYNTFFIMITFVNLWLTTSAGRFLNDTVSQIVILAAFVIVMILEKFNYKQMAKNIKNLTGLRKFKALKVTHLTGILFVLFVVLLPNVICTLDAAVPGETKSKVFGDNWQGVWGNSLTEQYYWADAEYWLSQQDTNITLPQNRPAILTWWDYGFYTVSMGEHPTVADNYQDGFYPASNFLTAQTEQEAIAVLIIRLTEGTQSSILYNLSVCPLPLTIKQIFRGYFPPYNETKTEDNQTINITQTPAENIINWLENRESSPSYNQPIAPEYGNTALLTNKDNAMYHDITNILLTLSDEQLINLYDSISNTSGYDIRYFGIEQRDLDSIFGVFPFLADKSTYGYTTTEDDWYKRIYVSKDTNQQYTEEQLKNMTQKEIQSLNLTASTITKDFFYNSTAYKLFYGIKSDGNQRYPSYTLRHFYIQYNSPIISISKFYEGANITGTVTVSNNPYPFGVIVVVDEYGLPHDAQYIQYDGSFKLIVPPGNNSLAILRDNQLVDRYQITTAITEEQATRKEPTNLFIPISINESSVNITISNAISNLTLTLTDTFTGGQQTIVNLQNKSYLVKNLKPDIYQFIVANETEFELFNQTTFLKPNSNSYNISIGLS